MSKLVIVESPAKAKNIKGYLGRGYDVIASMGHVRDLPAARLSVDISNNFEPKYAIIKGKENFVKDLKKKADEADYVYLATDPDREGEAISWHLATILGLDMNDKNRVTFNEITKNGVKNGMASPRAIDIDFVNAQQARRILDRLIGYKLSPFISQKIRRGLSAGRVQSVALRLIVDREEEIRAFNPEEYWSIDAKFTNPPDRKSFAAAIYSQNGEKIKIISKEQSDKILSDLENAEYVVSGVKKGSRKKNPTPPFITSTLQQEASRRLSFQARKTMKAAQELYEGVDVGDMGTVGLITYMRTDSLRISEEARAAGNQYIIDTYGEKYLPKTPRYYKSKSNIQDGHEAIRPSMPNVTPESVKQYLTTDQYKIYKLIWERFIASLMEACQQETMKIEIEANGYIFIATGHTVKFDGFTVLYEEKGDEEKNDTASPLPPMEKGDILKLKSILGNQHFTQPPARYTEASLTKALEENGVGRPSTYVTITSTILNREYVKREGKQFVPTELGEAVTNLLKERIPNIVNVKYTSKMETDLDKIDSGDKDYKEMIKLYYDEFEDPLEKAKEEMQGVKIKLKEEETDVVCEKCGRNMIIKVGRFGKFLACPGYPDCKNTKPLVFKTKAKCPECGGDVIEKKTKKGASFFGCSNYPNCNFMTWDAPSDEVCPNCSKSLFKRRGNVLYCPDTENCGFTKPVPRKKKTEE
ncbi:MAG: type I DNA topoisomerase [Acetobacter sp.]|nr:type I DNA topoisomerase [Bacteroides sp.]MCM1340729.1 type I DNA topoisomerase [Acetobacter sp.]MCM1433066.1 type I DNA topoisomerase [Clostridiales bacterium]